MNETLEILQHALGRNEFGQHRNPGNPDFRNHFCAELASDDFALCRQAVAKGLMTERAPSAISGGAHVFSVTEAGKRYIEQHSPKPPKLTRSQQRYEDWLSADGCMSFGEWLKRGLWKGGATC